MPLRLRTLIVDNYDSYTFNLLQLFDPDQLGNVVVMRNDQLEWERFEQEVLPYFDNVILSPGPGRPEREADFGICSQILKDCSIPVFGVCLGHQGIGAVHGAKISYGPEPVHGQLAKIQHNGEGLFRNLPQDFEAVRYHSLVIQDHDLPSDLIPTAWCTSAPLIGQPQDPIVPLAQHLQHMHLHDGSTPIVHIAQPMTRSLMGIQHRTLPQYGVQFHPESICTQFGKIILDNFFDLTVEFFRDSAVSDALLPAHIRAMSVVPTSGFTRIPESLSDPTIPPQLLHQHSVHIHALDPFVFPDPETVFASIFLTGPRSRATSWWLDSARQPHPMSRFSFMGGVETRSSVHGQGPIPGAAQAVIQYSTNHKEIQIQHYIEGTHSRPSWHSQLLAPSGSSFWDWTSTLMKSFGRYNLDATVTCSAEGSTTSGRLSDIPFDFFAGLVGFLGYEMKRESLEGYTVPRQQECLCTGHSSAPGLGAACACQCRRNPDALFVLAMQAVIYDHQEKRIYVLGVVNNNPTKDSTQPQLHQQSLESTVGFSSVASCKSWISAVSESIIAIADQSKRHQKSKRSSIISTGTTAPETLGAAQNGVAPSGSTPYRVRQRHRRQSSVGLVSPFKIDVTEDDYIRAIQHSLDYIHEGESYELCLTTQFRAKLPLYEQRSEVEQDGVPDKSFELYKNLRRLNPAPFSAFLSIPTAPMALTNLAESQTGMVQKMTILSSSPERFLKIGKLPEDELADQPKNMAANCHSQTVEMKPIKGTVAVAKGCFCREDEGCGVDDSEDLEEELSEHGHDDGSNHSRAGSEGGSLVNLVAGITTTATTVNTLVDPAAAPTAASVALTTLKNDRSSRRDKCAEARARENQRRVDALAKNIKERAENLMIVDLIRNDLAHVCSSHSVRVPFLMRVESYETVHQLVTTVRGELFEDVDAIQAVKACFPPGSMTGAPKLRSVQLLDQLEHHVRRGVYSGCLGYIGLPVQDSQVPNKIRSAVDLAVVIRTAVLTTPEPSSLTMTSIAEATSQAALDFAEGNFQQQQLQIKKSEGITGDLSVGAGGALTILSDASEEWREVMLKSRSVVPSVMAYLRSEAEQRN